MPGGHQDIRVGVQALRDLHRQALRLNNMPSGAVASLFPGAWRARFHGRGLEFEEVRAYQWGDDYRTVDWRVTARTGQMHTKLFHEERERTLYLVLDAGPTMHFGTRRCFKWVRAAEVAAIFAWLTLDQDDRVGAVIHGDARRCRILGSEHLAPPCGHGTSVASIGGEPAGQGLAGSAGSAWPNR